MMHWHSHADDLLSPPKIFGEQLNLSEIWHETYRIAWQGVLGVYKNPLVGASLVDSDGRFIDSAAHLKYGDKHAEVRLIDNVVQKYGSSILKGATLFVSLEPCAHQGKTPSCATFLTKLPLKKVIYAEQDPNPLVNGRGAEILQISGIHCEKASSLNLPFYKLTERFAHSLTSNRPFIGLKCASTLDGVMARAGDKRNWITGARSRQYGHWLRRVYHGIAVGCETVICDNPTLSARHEHYEESVPFRIVLDPKGRALKHWIEGNSNNLIEKFSNHTIWICAPHVWLDPMISSRLNQLEKKQIQILSIPYNDAKGFDLPILLSNLKQLGIESLLLEGGRGVWGSFLAHGFVDRIHLFQSMQIFGQKNTLHWTDHFHTRHHSGIDCQKIDLYPLDKDLLLEARTHRQDAGENPC